MKIKSNDAFINWIIVRNIRAIFHKIWITLDNAKTYCTGSSVTRYVMLSINHKLKPVRKLELQSTHKQKHNVAKVLGSPHKNIRNALCKVFQGILHFIYCPNFKQDELTIHTNHCLSSNYLNCLNYSN